MFEAPTLTWAEGLNSSFPKESAGVVTSALRDTQPGQRFLSISPWCHGRGLGRSESSFSCCSRGRLVVGADILQGRPWVGPLESVLKNRK